MFDQLKNDWKNQKGSNLASVDEIKSSILKSQKSLRNSLLTGVFLLVCTILVLAAIWYFFPFEKNSTVIALLSIIGIVAAASIYLAYIQIVMPQLSDDMQQTDQYIQDWINYQENTKRTTNWFLPFYNLSITIAILIYLQEVTSGNMMFMLIASASVIIWMLYVWFYLTPKMKKSTNVKLDKIIQNCKAIQKQMEGQESKTN